MDYVEVFASLDDGFEWFSGIVDCKHLFSAFNCDGFFDIDLGYQGRGQFWFSIANEYEGARHGKWDGWKSGHNFNLIRTIFGDESHRAL